MHLHSRRNAVNRYYITSCHKTNRSIQNEGEKLCSENMAGIDREREKCPFPCRQQCLNVIVLYITIWILVHSWEAVMKEHKRNIINVRDYFLEQLLPLKTNTYSWCIQISFLLADFTWHWRYYICIKYYKLACLGKLIMRIIIISILSAAVVVLNKKNNRSLNTILNNDSYSKITVQQHYPITGFLGSESKLTKPCLPQ